MMFANPKIFPCFASRCSAAIIHCRTIREPSLFPAEAMDTTTVHCTFRHLKYSGYWVNERRCYRARSSFLRMFP